MTNRTGSRILTSIAVLTMIASAIGFFVMLFANTFFLDDYAKYGEVPIPGSSSVALPAGDVTVTFHTVLIGGSGSGLPVPPLKYSITGPGGADAQLTEDYGSTTTVNNDARVRIGYLRVPVDGRYRVELDGNVSAYLNPTLAFGQGSSYGSVQPILGAVFGVALVVLVTARIWAGRARRNARGGPDYAPPLAYPESKTFTATDYGIRIQELETIARLRDSGALTEDEFQAEKKRILE